MNEIITCPKCKYKWNFKRLCAICPKCGHKFLVTHKVNASVMFKGSCAYDSRSKLNNDIKVVSKDEAKENGNYVSEYVGEI